MFILWNHMVTTKHKRRSLVPLSLPTSQPHPGTSYYWFSRLQGLRIIAMNHRRVISKYPKSPNFRAPNEKKHQMFLSKKLFFSKWGKGISFWPRDKTQWSSVLASSTLVVVKRTCENPGELSTHPTEGTVRGDVFFPNGNFPRSFCCWPRSQQWKVKKLPSKPPRNSDKIWPRTSTYKQVVIIDSQPKQCTVFCVWFANHSKWPYMICTMFDLSQYWGTFDDPSSDVNQNDALEVW